MSEVDKARRAARVLETAVGEALGPATLNHDRRSGARSLTSYLGKQDAHRFRLMAAHRDLWWPVLAEPGARQDAISAPGHLTTWQPSQNGDG